NLRFLVDAWRPVRDRYGVELALAGRRREDFAALPAEPGLRILGEALERDLPSLYSQALAFVYPSLYEGFGLPVLEAMQCGAFVAKPRALLICPEAPYPLNGGGALRAASVLEYLAQIYCVDAIVFRQPGARVELPAGLADRLMTIELPAHSKSNPARLLRNG